MRIPIVVSLEIVPRTSVHLLNERKCFGVNNLFRRPNRNHFDPILRTRLRLLLKVTRCL